jgi:hypothetical protein
MLGVKYTFTGEGPVIMNFCSLSPECNGRSTGPNVVMKNTVVPSVCFCERACKNLGACTVLQYRHGFQCSIYLDYCSRVLLEV